MKTHAWFLGNSLWNLSIRNEYTCKPCWHWRIVYIFPSSCLFFSTQRIVVVRNYENVTQIFRWLSLFPTKFILSKVEWKTTQKNKGALMSQKLCVTFYHLPTRLCTWNLCFSSVSPGCSKTVSGIIVSAKITKLRKILNIEHWKSLTLTSLVSPGFKRPTFGLTQYRFGAVVLILKAITSFSVGLVTEMFEEETLNSKKSNFVTSRTSSYR